MVAELLEDVLDYRINDVDFGVEFVSKEFFVFLFGFLIKGVYGLDEFFTDALSLCGRSYYHVEGEKRTGVPVFFYSSSHCSDHTISKALYE